MGELFEWLLKVENIKTRRFTGIFLVLTPLLFFFSGGFQGATFEGPIFTAGGLRVVFIMIMLVMFFMGLLLITWPKGHHLYKLYPPEEDPPPMEWQIEEAKSEATRLELMRDEANRKRSEAAQEQPRSEAGNFKTGPVSCDTGPGERDTRERTQK